VTQHGELPGTRNEFIHWLQDSSDQAGLVRGYVKYAHEIRRGVTARQLVHRALQIARSEPPGPVYLAASREVMEEEVPPGPDQSPWWSPVAPVALAPQVADEIAGALLAAANPLVVTSHLGRDPDAVAALTQLCDLVAAGVVESAPMRMNFPADHPLHLGYQWNTASQNPVLAAADVVLVAGSDVPWIPATNAPRSGARIYVLDTDPVKEQMTLWHVPATRYARADLAIALRQVASAVRRQGGPDRAATQARAQRLAATHQAQRAEWAAREQPGPDGTITPAYLVACVRDAIGPDALVLTEAITNYQVVSEHLRASRPGSLLGSGGSSLGWSGGAAVGAKLAAPGRTVVSLVGDGSYLFGVPSSAQWLARRCQAPSLTVIFDNQGWSAPVLSALALHPDGAVAALGGGTGFAPGADLPAVAAAAGGAYAASVTDADRLPATLRRALAQVRRGRSAVVSVRVPAPGPG
jgi:acetolactate synthase-1/2/3 large subunit